MLDNATQEREDIRASSGRRRMGEQCDHLLSTPVAETPDNPVCARCLEDGARWVALRMCLSCGEIGCCDSSPGQHATAHFHETTHPVMQSAEPGEDWRWCYVHHLTA